MPYPSGTILRGVGRTYTLAKHSVSTGASEWSISLDGDTDGVPCGSHISYAGKIWMLVIDATVTGGGGGPPPPPPGGPFAPP